MLIRWGNKACRFEGISRVVTGGHNKSLIVYVQSANGDNSMTVEESEIEDFWKAVQEAERVSREGSSLGRLA
jgi:hypothetical protein